MLPMLPDIPLPALEFVDTCDGAPNCFTVIDSYSTTEVAPRLPPHHPPPPPHSRRPVTLPCPAHGGQ